MGIKTHVKYRVPRPPQLNSSDAGMTPWVPESGIFALKALVYIPCETSAPNMVSKDPHQDTGDLVTQGRKRLKYGGSKFFRISKLFASSESLAQKMKFSQLESKFFFNLRSDLLFN